MNFELSREQARAVDRIAMECFGIPGLILMENAGRSAATVIEPMLKNHWQVAILCGGGNNGGDGYVIARHLFNAGIRVVLIPVGKLKGIDEEMLKEPLGGTSGGTSGETSGETSGGRNALIARRMGIPRGSLEDLEQSHLIVDALLGTGFVAEGRVVRSPVREAIVAINQAAAKVVAIDLPSGLDCDTGQPADVAVRADLTVSFVGPKRGFAQPLAKTFTGKVMVADIGVPKGAIEMAMGQHSL